MKKYDIFLVNNLKFNYSQDLTKDISLNFESSSILKSAKYIKSKTIIQFNFLKYSPMHCLKLFFITVTGKTKDGYIGYDTSCRCLINWNEKLNVNTRYEMYGKLEKNKLLILNCEKVLEIDYKKLVYQLL